VTIDAHERFHIARDVHVREFDGELVILDLVKGDYFGVNEIGARLWHGIAMGKSCGEIANDLAREYATDPQHLLNDLVALANDFIANGLLVRSTSVK